MKRFTALLVLVCACAGLTRGAMAAPRIEVEALFPEAAVVKVDGQRKMLRVGDAFQGVTLLAAGSASVTLEVNGQQQVHGLTRSVGSTYQAPQKQVVKIPRDARMQYQTTALINGRSMPVLVDTGANVLAMNSVHARALGVPAEEGQPSVVETASGRVNARIVNLRSVSVGGIRVDNVRASVVEGEFPAMILLGMTYLQHVDIEENNGVLSLSRAW
jgi:aspartyl protease family protein